MDRRELEGSEIMVGTPPFEGDERLFDELEAEAGSGVLGGEAKLELEEDLPTDGSTAVGRALFP